jgi:hypothetical protein
LKEAPLLAGVYRHWPGVLLPFPPSEVNPNLSQEEKHQRLSRRNGEEAYLDLLKAYLPAIISVAFEFNDPRAVKMPLDERVVVGMFGLKKGQRRYRPEEYNPDDAVFNSVRADIRRAVLAWHGKVSREAAMTGLIEDLADEDNGFLPLEILEVEQETPEETACRQLSLSQLFMAVADSYRNHCQNGPKQRQENIERNLTIFYFVFWQRYDYSVHGEGPYPNKRIAEAFGLKRQRVQQIYYEVRDTILADHEFRAHLAEMLGLSTEEAEQKIKAVVDQ